MKYFCVHHSPATDRKQYIEEMAAKQDISVEFVIEDTAEYWFVAANHGKIHSVHAADNKNKLLNNAELSCYFKHLRILANNQNSEEPIFIIEDDLAEPEFSLNEYVPLFLQEMCKQNIDILYVGSIPCWNISPHPTEKINVRTNAFSHRLGHAYILSPKVLNNKRFLEFMQDIKHPYDMMMSEAVSKLGIIAGVTYPHIYQRTQNGEVQSLLR